MRSNEMFFEVDSRGFTFDSSRFPGREIDTYEHCQRVLARACRVISEDPPAYLGTEIAELAADFAEGAAREEAANG